jgi:HK97 family phage major capsid protein
VSPVTEVPPGLGSAVTPEQWATYVMEHLSAQSVVLASGATRITTAQRQVHVPRLTSDGTAAWFSELEEITEAGPTGNELTLVPKKCAALCKLSSEVIDDSEPSVLDAVGTAMTRAVALTADRAILNGSDPKGPVGVYGQAGQHVVGPITIDHLIDAAGLIADVGGQARVAYVHPTNHTALMKEKDSQGRPLLTPDFAFGPSSTIYGLAVWATKGVALDTALVCDPAQIVVAVRNDPTVAVSSDAIFTADGSICRVIARLDCGVNDANGLVSIAATATAEATTVERQQRRR